MQNPIQQAATWATLALSLCLHPGDASAQQDAIYDLSRFEVGKDQIYVLTNDAKRRIASLVVNCDKGSTVVGSVKKDGNPRTVENITTSGGLTKTSTTTFTEGPSGLIRDLGMTTTYPTISGERFPAARYCNPTKSPDAVLVAVVETIAKTSPLTRGKAFSLKTIGTDGKEAYVSVDASGSVVTISKQPERKVKPNYGKVAIPAKKFG